jgi:acetyl esterase
MASALHPDLEAFLELAADAPPMNTMTPAQARAAYDRATHALDTPGADVPVDTLALPCRDGHRLPARLYRGGGRGTMLYFHGGGYVVGGLDSHDSLCRDLAGFAACQVLAVDYRLAPEHRFPTAFHDAEDAHAWLLQQGTERGLDASRLVIGGDSVGGTLATALCLSARASGHPQPALQLLLYPCTSACQDSDSHHRYATGHLLEKATLQWMFGHSLRDARDRLDWRFAPLQAADLSGLARAHIVLAEHDPLVDEGNAYAERLRQAGVPTELVVYRGMVHDFARLGALVADAGRLRRDLASALTSAFAA